MLETLDQVKVPMGLVREDYQAALMLYGDCEFGIKTGHHYSIRTSICTIKEVLQIYPWILRLLPMPDEYFHVRVAAGDGLLIIGWQ